MEDQNCIPEIEPESRSIILDGTYRAVDSPNIDGQLQKNRQMDDSQLVGTPAVIAGDSAIGGLTGSTVEVKTEVKRKRGRPPRGQGKPPPPPAKKQKEEEDVCFICFDGGSLVLCDRRGCPKAYHPACIKRDEAFFRSKAKWNCGWHICSVCQKASNYMCYTCPYSLCKGCTKDADYVCVRGDKGFCTTCMKTVMLIENKEQGNMEMAQVDFDDKTSWEYLFKIYWIYLKEKLSLTLTELTQAKSPWKESGTIACKRQLTGVQDTANDVKNCISERSSGYLEGNSSTIRKYPELLSIPNEDSLSLEKPSIDMGTSLVGCTKWATEELLDFVAHMKNGDMSVLSKFDVQALLLEYIKRNNLHDPRRKSQILCDLRLKTLFGKPCVGHFEMVKLLEFHFPVKEDPPKDGVIQGEVVVKPIEILADESNNNNLIDKDKKGKSRKKGEERSPQTNLNEYAAIDVNNINLIYLRRNLMENLLEDKEKFHDKVVGSVVRIRIFGGEQKQDLFRLVQVVGTTKVSVPYKISNTTADVKLEILNLDKKEGVSVDAISNQDFSEDECRRLRQSIKCGLVKRFTVGEIQEKAMALQAVRLDDWLETEVLRLNNLCERASENGRKKELRECVEKLQLLKTPEERQRRLCQIPDIHSDPNMDPNYESEEDAGELDNKKQVEYVNPRCSGYNRTWNNSNPPCEQSRNASASSYPDKEESAARALQKLREGIDVCRSSAYNNGERKIWHYRDPKGKIQGPFCMVQLQKWSTTGYFPPNMRIWEGDRQDDSILLTDALNGQLHNKAMPSLNDNSSGSQEVSGASNSKLYNSDIRTSENVNGKRDGKLTEGRWHSNINESVRGDRWAHSSVWTEPVVSISKEILAASSLKDHDSFKGKHSPLSSSPLSGREYAIHSHLEINHEIKRCNSDPDHENRNSHITTFCKSTGEHVLENHPNGQGFSVKSSEEKWSRSPENFSSINLDLNSTVSVTKSTDSPDQISEAAENKESVSSNVRVHESDIADLPSPMPNTSNDDLKGQAVENKQSMSSKVPIHDLGPSWSSASGLVDGGVGVQLPDMTEEWVGYSPNRVKRSVEEWDSSLISVSSSKPPEGLCDPVATATSRSGEFFNFFPPHPVSNISSWHINVNEPIEFSTLAEESVSDLLAEVDAMESQCGLPSPTSVMKCG